jgi:hypothetical protein
MMKYVKEEKRRTETERQKIKETRPDINVEAME